ncbi:MAG: BNR repeat-containing protein [Bacteroidales bacterium]|nr:BNR repeat-containing protein [Bacteroidales bacterium]
MHRIFLKTVCIGIVSFFSQGIFAQSYPPLDNQKIDGYKSVWFRLGQPSQYGDKYSGGMGTYTAKHIPLAIYAPEVKKTFFVYGGMAEGRTTSADASKNPKGAYGNYLLCMAGCFDHQTGTVSKPVVVYDKRGVFDPHDNPAIAMDADGYVWVFVSGRGRGRTGFGYRSSQPYSIDAFEQMFEDERTYPQPKYIPGKGFLHLFTKYTGVRLLYFSTSPDGRTWTEHRQLAAIKRPEDKNGGHYQISDQHGEKIVFFFNWHPNGGVDKRTNIYYLQTADFGETWTKVDGTPVNVPVTEVNSPTLIREFFSKDENVYIKDVAFDEKGYPMALYVSGKGHQPGPDNGLKEWQVIYWNGKEWENSVVTTSDHNYDTGSIWTDGKKWTVIAPTENSPQPWGCGGELVLWQSVDKGKNWKKVKQITRNSPRNHNYVREVVNGVDPFRYFWSDGNPDEPSISLLYFGDSKGNVWQLPYNMTEEHQKPALLSKSKSK